MSESGNHVALNHPASEKPQFPEGLRVLAVDDNVVCLKVIAALLIKCRFVATVTTKATEALEMLRRNKESYDIVITDVEMPDMNGFKLLEIVGLEMDMPVIMMSASDDTKTVMKGIKHGARDYLTKPVRLADVKTIWKHVIKKNVHDPIKLGHIEEKKDEHPEPSKTKKQRGTKGKEEETSGQCDEATYRNRKPRLIWSKELHYKFVDVFQQIGREQGIDKAVPKKILERMNDPRLTRENVASHLQKFRNTLKREGEKLAKMNEDNEKNNTVLSKAIVHLPNPTTVSTGIPSFGTQNQTFGSFRANNRRPLFYNPANQHNILLQQNVIPRPVADQKRSNMHIPAPIFSQNSCSETELDWMRFHSNIPRTNMVNNHSTDSTSHFPGFNTGPTTMPNVSYSCPPSGAFNPAGVPFHGSTQLNPIPQPESQVQSTTYGQYEGTNLVNFNGRGETNGHFVQHPFENSENESNGVYNNYNYPDDDLSYIIRQFSSNPPPRL